MNVMNVKKIITLLLALVLAAGMIACGTKGSGTTDGMSNEPKNAEEAAAMHKELMAQENAILSENTALWEKVFMAADKGMTMQEDGKNYGEFLLDTIESAKDQFTADELKLLQGEAEKIRDIEDKLTMLEEKYPNIAQESIDGDMSVPAGSDMTTPPNDGSMQKFPAFEGKDLDGNTVKSSELFSKNAVTVVNFWFTTCNPCVGELSELDALNKKLAEKGGALIGVNTFTLDGDEAAISEAKNVLAKKASSPPISLPIPPPMWLTGTATSWATPSWVLLRKRIRRRHCKPKSTRRSPPIWADKRRFPRKEGYAP